MSSTIDNLSRERSRSWKKYRLKIRKTKNHYDFFYNQIGNKWVKVGDGYDAEFNDIKVGFAATSPVSQRNIPVEFDYFKVSQ